MSSFRFLSPWFLQSRGYFCHREALERICTREGRHHFPKITSVPAASRAHFSHFLAVFTTTKPLQGMLQMPSMPASWTPNKHTFDRLMAQKAHCHSSSTVLADLARACYNALAFIPCTLKRIGGVLQRLTASWTRLMDPERTKFKRETRVSTHLVCMRQT